MDQPRVVDNFADADQPPPRGRLSPGDPPRWLNSPLLIFIVALAIRLAGITYAHTYRSVPTINHFGFPDEMGSIAASIATGEGFGSPYRLVTGPTAQQPPVYPYLLSVTFRLFGVDTQKAAFAILSLNSLFSALTCILVLLIGRKVFGSVVGTLSAWAWAVWPNAVLFPISRVWNESLTALLLAAIFWITLRVERVEGIGAWTRLGFLWGIAALTSPAVLSLMPFLLGWACYLKKRKRSPWGRNLAMAMIVFALVVVPWIARNYRAFGRFVFIRDDFGLELHLGNHAGATGIDTGGLFPPENAAEMEQFLRQGETAYMAAKQGEALRFIKRHPQSFVWLCVQRFGELWIWTGPFREFGSVFDPFVWNVLYFLLPALAVGGLVLAFRNSLPAAWPFAFLLCVFPLIYVITVIYPRFRHPVEPEMLLLATYALVCSARVLGDWEARSLPAPTAHVPRVRAEKRALMG